MYVIPSIAWEIPVFPSFLRNMNPACLAILRLFPGKLLNIFLLIPAFKHINSKKIKVKPCVNVHYSATNNLSPCAMVNVNLITRQQVNTESLISKYKHIQNYSCISCQ